MTHVPCFAVVTIGSGSYLGSTVRDLTLASELHRRGYRVAVYWMLERNPSLVDRGIRQRMLCYGTRYQFRRPSEILDNFVGRLLFLLPQAGRVHVTQGLLSGYVDRLLTNLIHSLNATEEGDRRLAKRLSEFLARDGVDYLLLSFASLGPLAMEAKKIGAHPFDYLLTFQGDEQFANYARRVGLAEAYRRRLAEAVRHTPWPAITVSRDYLQRISDEMEIDRGCLTALYNGIQLSDASNPPPFSLLATVFPDLDAHQPIVAYVGRQDSEKGVDLLLYAAKLLKNRNIPMQLVICGSTAKGRDYQRILADLADHLALTIHHAGAVTCEVRDALYAHSRCMVFPSVNREAFGLVAAEAMSFGTPVLVPDYGGITEVIRDGTRSGGLTFKTWDSGDLARQLERLLTDERLYRELSGNTRMIASRFSAEQMTDDVLEHLGVSAGAAELRKVV